MRKMLMVAVAMIALGCGDDSGSAEKPSSTDSGKTKDASTRDARSASNNTDDETDASTDEPGDKPADGDAGSTPVDNGEPDPIDDAGSIEVTAPDGGTVVITPGKDGGTQLSGMGSCCSEHSTAGCNNADLMVCVCEKDASCCTKAWTAGCAAIVNSRWCQDGVRDCVCDPNGKVQAQQCCNSEWGKTCDTYAQKQCDAVPGCF